MIGNKGNSNSNAYFTRSGSFSTHGSRKGTHHLYDFALTEDQLNSDAEKLKALSKQEADLSNRINEIRLNLGIDSKSGFTKLYNNWNKSNPYKPYLDDWQKEFMIKEGMKLTVSLLNIHAELKSLKDLNRHQIKHPESFNEMFVKICEARMSTSDFQRLTELTFRKMREASE